MNQNIIILKAIRSLIDVINYSSTYLEPLIEMVDDMIEHCESNNH